MAVRHAEVYMEIQRRTQLYKAGGTLFRPVQPAEARDRCSSLRHPVSLHPDNLLQTISRDKGSLRNSGEKNSKIQNDGWRSLRRQSGIY
jgi:hypothetical protein